MLKPNESIEQQRKFLQILVNHFLSKKDRDSSEIQGIQQINKGAQQFLDEVKPFGEDESLNN